MPFFYVRIETSEAINLYLGKKGAFPHKSKSTTDVAKHNYAIYVEKFPKYGFRALEISAEADPFARRTTYSGNS